MNINPDLYIIPLLFIFAFILISIGYVNVHDFLSDKLSNQFNLLTSIACLSCGLIMLIIAVVGLFLYITQ